MITYPVDLNATFTTKLKGVVKRNLKWPRADGMELYRADPEQVILQERVGEKPPYDPANEYLVESWVDDDVNQVATLTYTVTPLPQNAKDRLAEIATRDAKTSELSGAIATLRSWASQEETFKVSAQNVVATVQTLVDRDAAFHKHFANFLEVQGIK